MSHLIIFMCMSGSFKWHAMNIEVMETTKLS